MRQFYKRCLVGGSVFLSGSIFLAAQAAADSLGVIQVESTTIDDRFEQKRDEPSSIGVIQGEVVDAEHTENIQQLLQGIPGITTEVQNGDSVKIHIRGIENQVYMGEKPGVAVVIDGVPVFERTGSVNIDLDNIESIKVIKGGASYLFGDDALSGAVIITTKRGAKQAGYRLAAEGGDFSYYKGLMRAGFAGEKSNGHVQVSRRATDGYHDDSASRADYVNGKYQYYLSEASDLTFGFENSHRKKNSHGTVKGVTAAATDPTSTDPAYNDYSNKYDVRLGKYYLTYAKDLADNSNLMVNGYYFGDHTQFFTAPITGGNEYNYFNDYDQAQRGVKTEYRSGGERNAWLGALDLRDNLYYNKTQLVDCGGLGGTCTGADLGKLTSDSVTGEKVYAAYGEFKRKLTDKLVVTANGRADHIAYDYSYSNYNFRSNATSTGVNDKSFDVTSWRLGMNYAARENLDYYANVSTGFRAPTPEQLFIGSGNPTSFIAPNPNLKPEYALNAEVGLRSKAELMGAMIDVDLGIFQIDRHDYIQSSAGQYTTSGTDNTYENISDVRNRGIELSLRSDPVKKWSWDAAYTYLDAQYTDYSSFILKLKRIGGVCTVGTAHNFGSAFSPNWWCLQDLNNTGNTVPRTPNHHLNLTVRYRPAPAWTVSGELDAVSDYYADEMNQLKISGYNTFNLLVNYDIKRNNNLWSAFLRIDNVFDTFYYNTVRGNYDSNEDGVFDAEDLSITVNPGRMVTAGVSVQF